MFLITDAEKLILSGSTKCFFYLRHFTAHSMKNVFLGDAKKLARHQVWSHMKINRNAFYFFS